MCQKLTSMPGALGEMELGSNHRMSFWNWLPTDKVTEEIWMDDPVRGPVSFRLLGAP